MGGSGHLLPLLAVAAALRRQGHDGVVLVPPSLAEAAAGLGFPVVTGEQPSREVVDAIWARVRKGPPEQVVGLIDQELFAGLALDAMREAARAACTEFAPDLVVREPCEYATAIEAHHRGVAQVQVGISAAVIEAGVLEDVADSLEHRCAGVTRAIRDAPYLTAFPEPLDPSPWRDTRRYRHAPSSPRPLPYRWPGMEHRPLVYVTFGSVLGHLNEARSVYRAALAAVGELPIRVLMTTGHAFSADALEPVPANTRIEPWVPQDDVFASAQVVVCHGGSGTINGALASGVALVVCPLFADQTANADAVARAGAARTVRSRRPPDGLLATLGNEDVPAISEAITSCLCDPSYGQAAQRIARTIASAPTLDEVVGAVVRAARPAWRSTSR